MVHSSAQLRQFSCEWLTLHAAVANPAPKWMAMTASEAVLGLLGDTNPCCRASQPHQERRGFKALPSFLKPARGAGTSWGLAQLSSAAFGSRVAGIWLCVTLGVHARHVQRRGVWVWGTWVIWHTVVRELGDCDSGGSEWPGVALKDV